jgi:hypothetical protein
MATHAEIKKAILDTAGNPVSGVIVDMADEFAEAILALEKPATTQTRVQKPEEKRDLSHHSV